MTPFNGLLFFYLLALLLIPAAFMGYFRIPIKYYGMFVTLIMLTVIFDTFEKRITLLVFYLSELFVVLLYSSIRRKTARRGILWLFLAVAIAPLTIVKLGGIFKPFEFIHLLGISYMTFRAVQVLIEIYDGLVTEVDALDFSYFLLFFPVVSSGPVDRYRRFKLDLDNVPDRTVYIELFKKGVWRIMWGALLNIVISAQIYTNWLAVLPSNGFLPTLSYMYGYMLFLFFNFAGYSLMAIGVSYILGIKTPDNFNMPFLSRDMKDFWSRWHMSLSTWLKDYIYTRFTAASLRGDWFKDKRTGSYIGYIITMLTMGVWHGLTPAYIIYGAYHAALMCINDLLDTRWKAYRKLKKKKPVEILSVIITCHLFAFGLLIFSGRII